jgi:hypothetical protein
MNIKETGEKNSEINGDSELLTPVDTINPKDSTLGALINDQRSIAEHHLTEKLGRKPTSEEIDKWMQAHTESY